MHTAPTRSTNPFDDDENGSNMNDSDDDYSDEALDRILGEMDIDADYKCWTSFRASMSMKTSSSVASPARSDDLGSIGEGKVEEDADQLTECEQVYIDKWSRRVGKEEVYSKYYHPVPREAREVQSLAAFLGLSDKQTEGGGGFLHKMSSNLKQESVQGKDEAYASMQDASKLLFPAADEPKSILLKRGPVLLRKRGQVDREERELILLSHGFIVATPLDLDEKKSSPRSRTSGAAAADGKTTTGNDKQQHKASNPAAFMKKMPPGMAKIPSGLKKKVIHRHFESAEMLSSAIRVEDVTAERNSFAVIVNNDDEGHGDSHKCRFVFTCAKYPQKQAWINAFETALYNARIHNSAGGAAPAPADSSKHELFGGASRRTDERTSEPNVAAKAAGAMNMAALQERGRKLEKLENKTANLEQNASDYRDTARQLKEKAKKQSMFGF